MLKIFITNLSEYNNGNLIGEWISLPTDSSFINQTIISNGIDFQSQIDNLYFTNGDIELVYPSIFEKFRNKS